MNQNCCKQIFENEDEVSKGYSKEHQRSQQLQTTKTLSQSDPQSEENNQILQQPQINNEDKADLNIQQNEKIQFNNQQKINIQDKSQNQNPNPLKIINHNDDNHFYQKKVKCGRQNYIGFNIQL